jgi:hypothetical protein
LPIGRDSASINVFEYGPDPDVDADPEADGEVLAIVPIIHPSRRALLSVVFAMVYAKWALCAADDECRR